MSKLDFSQSIFNQINILDEINASIETQAKYQNDLDRCVFDTCNILLKMEEDSKKAAALERKRFVIQTVLQVAGLIAAVVAAVGTLIPLMCEL